MPTLTVNFACMSTVFLTGYSGFIGGHLSKTLLEKGHNLRLLGRSAPKGLEGYSNQIHWTPGDIASITQLHAAMEGCEIGYHLAGFAKLWSKDPSIWFQVNTLGAENVMKVALEQGLNRLVHTSTAGTIGPSHERSGAHEETIRLHDFFHPYESSKFLSEERALRYAQRGLDVVIVNPTRVYGPGELSESNAFVRLASMYLQGQWNTLPGDGSRLGSYAWIDDVVNGMIAAMENGRTGERYLLGGANLSYSDFFQILSEVSGHQVKMKPVPLSVMLAFARIQTWRAAITGKPPLIVPSWVKKYAYDWAVDSSKANNELGYSITPFRVGMDATVQWLRQLRA